MIALEEFTYAALRSEKMSMPPSEGVVANTNTASCVQLVNTLLVDIEVKIIYDKIDFYTSFSGIDKFLHSYTSYSLVIHVISSYHYHVLSSVNFVPQNVPKGIVVVVKLNFRLRLILI